MNTIRSFCMLLKMYLMTSMLSFSADDVSVKIDVNKLKSEAKSLHSSIQAVEFKGVIIGWRTEDKPEGASVEKAKLIMFDSAKKDRIVLSFDSVSAKGRFMVYKFSLATEFKFNLNAIDCSSISVDGKDRGIKGVALDSGKYSIEIFTVADSIK